MSEAQNKTAKKIFVLWSGGADSTLLLQRCLDDPAYEVVLAGYVYVWNNEAKADAELQAIAEMLPHLRARGDKLVWLGTVMQVSLTKSNPNLAFKQVPIWLLSLVAALHPPVDEVALGYIRNDHPDEPDVTAHLDDIRRAYDAYRPLMHRAMPALVFPLLDVGKREVLAELDPALRAACVWCEAPMREGDRFTPCGRCRLCKQRGTSVPSSKFV